MAAAVVMPERARAMAARLAGTAEQLGVDDDGRALLGLAFDVGMAPRIEAGLDDHHPDFLHTARTALILMDDAGASDLSTLAAALVTETRDPTLRARAAATARLGQEARSLAEAVPDPVDPDTLLERLVTAPAAAALIAVGERLDHARHLHLRDSAEWAPYHALTRAVYAPAAARVHPMLARRISWWCDTFQRRFLTGA